MTPTPSLPADIVQVAQGGNQSLEWLKASDLRVDPRYQRPLDMKRVRKMARVFNADAFGVLYVSKRADGGYWLIDGQHRQALLHEIGWGDQTAACMVFSGLTLEAEAEIFILSNSGSQPNALAKFKAALTQQEPQAVEIDRIVRRCGLQVGAGGNQRTLQAVAALRRAYDKGGSFMLERTLRCILDAWGSDSSNFQADLILGLTLFQKRYNRDQPIDMAKLATQIAKTTPNDLLARARARRPSGSGSIWATEIPDLLVTHYNKSFRGAGAEARKLPRWEPRTNVREIWT